MSFKIINNPQEGNEIESIIYERVRRYVSVVYPSSDVRLKMITATHDRKLGEGVYLYFEGKYTNMYLQMSDRELRKTILIDRYTPLSESGIKESFEIFMRREEHNRRLKELGIIPIDRGYKYTLQLVHGNKKKGNSFFKKLLSLFWIGDEGHE